MENNKRQTGADDADQQVIKNIKRLQSFLHDAYILQEPDKYASLMANFRAFRMQLTALFKKWFPRAKPCSDAEIIYRIFGDVPYKQRRDWVKYSLSCLIRSVERVFNNIDSYRKRGEEMHFRQEVDLLNNISFEAVIFIERSYYYIEEKDMGASQWRRTYIYGHETILASVEILRKVVHSRSPGSFVIGPTSIFLLRQSIELWLKEIFGINCITNDKGMIQRLPPERLFALLDEEGKKVQLPVPKSVIQKIHSWTQTYVHAGWTVNIWEIEHAQHVLQPIFDQSKVIIKKGYYNSIEQQLRDILNNDKLKLSRTKRPESTIV